MSFDGTGTAPARERVLEFVYQPPSSGTGLSTDGEETASVAHGNVTAQSESVPSASTREISRLISEARAEGVREGEAQARKVFEDQISGQQRSVSDALLSFQKERETYYAKAEGQLVHLALAIAGKILHREAQVDRMVIAGLVKVMLERMQHGSKAIVRIRPEEAFSWRHFFSTNRDLEIVEDSTLEPHACRLETDLGSADMGLDAQLKEVEQGFFDLLAQRPDTK